MWRDCYQRCNTTVNTDGEPRNYAICKMFKIVSQFVEKCYILVLTTKVVSKVSRHFAFSVNIFRNSSAVSDFSFSMSSYGHKKNFSQRKLENHWFSYRKMKMKNFRFQMGSLLDQKKHMVRIPSLCFTQICICFYYPATWTSLNWSLIRPSKGFSHRENISSFWHGNAR